MRQSVAERPDSASLEYMLVPQSGALPESVIPDRVLISSNERLKVLTRMVFCRHVSVSHRYVLLTLGHMLFTSSSKIDQVKENEHLIEA